MNSIPLSTTIVVHSDSGGNAAELVRGRVEPLIARLEPMVGIQSVTLDLGSVERIDAAGIAALIRLYCMASKSGHEFTISHPTQRVEHILSLVGIDRVLSSRNARPETHSGVRLELTAA
jgi:anti-anti-sigma factor